MTQVTPAANHPLKIKSEMPRFNNQSIDRQNKTKQQELMADEVKAFLNAGGCVDVLPGFPEVIKSRAAHSWMAGF